VLARSEVCLLSERSYHKWTCSIGIKVSHTPGAVDEATATTALYLLLSALRQFSIAERNVRSGKWKADLPPAHDPSSMALGILGMGGIGSYFAKMAHALPVKKIYYHNRHPRDDAPQWAEYVPTMEEFLKKSDVLSVHCPLNEHTVGLIGEREIGMLRKGSVIINTARGKVIDENALIKALKDGHVSIGFKV
jgi:glyoxylate reductase